MARKRGGIAGFWDRQKKVIKPIAMLTAGALTGGLGGAVVGGLMNGLDREGKGGIGFDVKKGAIGAAQGYGMGKLGALGRAKAGALFTGGGAPSALPGAVSNMTGLTPGAYAASGPAPITSVNPASLFAPSSSTPSFASKTGSFLTKNQGLISGATKAVGGVLDNAAQRDQYAASNDIQRQRLQLELDQDKREQERRERIARLLMPLYNQQARDLNIGAA